MKYVQVKDKALFTPILTYKKEQQTITVIGAIHFAPASYYQELQQEIHHHEEGFYEGLKPAQLYAKIPPEKQQFLKLHQQLGEAYVSLSKVLGMQFQREALSYGKNWVNPDLSLDQFILGAPENGLRKLQQTFQGLTILAEIAQDYPEKVARFTKGQMFSLARVPSLIQDLFAYLALGNVYGSLLLGRRNESLFRALHARLHQEKSLQLGVVYGAKHLEGLEHFVHRQGFLCRGERWIPAWEMTEQISYWEAARTVAEEIKKIREC